MLKQKDEQHNSYTLFGNWIKDDDKTDFLGALVTENVFKNEIVLFVGILSFNQENFKTDYKLGVLIRGYWTAAL